MRTLAICLLTLVALSALPALAADAPVLKNTSMSIPWEDFKALLDRLSGQQAVEEPDPPVEYAIGGGRLSGVLDEGRLEITAEYSLAVLKKGWVRVPLVNAGQPLEGIYLDDKPAPAANDGGTVSMILKGPSEHKLTLRYRAVAGMLPGPGAASLQLPRAAGQALALKSGPKVSDISVDGATMSREKDGTTHAILTGESLTVRYTVALEKKEAQEEKLPPKVFVENNTLLSVDEGFIRAVVQIAYEVRHAPVTEFRVKIPAGFEPADCTGASLIGWKMDEATRVLAATVGFEVKGAYNLTIVLERSTKEESFTFALPAVPAQDVERERGFFAVQVTGGVEVTSGEVKDLQPVDVKELPPALSGGATNPVVLSFKYLRHPFSGEIKVVRHKTQAVLAAAIDSANYVLQITEDGDCVTRAVYTVRNNRKQFLEIKLPPGEKTALWSTFVANKPVKPSASKDSAILLPLEKSSYAGSELNSFSVEIIYYTSLGRTLTLAGTIPLALPVVDLPVSRSMLTVFGPGRFTYSRLSGTMREPYVQPVSQTFTRELSEKEIMDLPKPAERNFMKSQALVSGEGQGRAPADKKMKDMEETQSKAEAVFQDRLRAAQNVQDSSGSLPARFAIPQAGAAMRYEELITIGEAPTLRLMYARRGLSSLLSLVAFLLTAALAWYARRILAQGRRGGWIFGLIAAGILAFAAIGVSVWCVILGAAVGLGAHVASWVIEQIRLRTAAKKEIRTSAEVR